MESSRLEYLVFCHEPGLLILAIARAVLLPQPGFPRSAWDEHVAMDITRMKGLPRNNEGKKGCAQRGAEGMATDVRCLFKRL